MPTPDPRPPVPARGGLPPAFLRLAWTAHRHPGRTVALVAGAFALAGFLGGALGGRTGDDRDEW